MKLRPNAPGVANRANILGYIGASGSGKSASLKAALKMARPARLLIWDPQDEYSMLASQATGSMKTVLGLVQAAGRGGFSIRFLPSADLKMAAKQFDAFCRIAYAAGHCALVAEELAFVTTASHAPPGWSLVNLKGRHRGLTLYGTTQRPAKVDKDFFGNCTRLRCGRLNYATDRKVMADVLGVPVEAIAAMLPLEYFEKDMGTGQVVYGVVNPTGAQAPAKPWSAAKLVGRTAAAMLSGSDAPGAKSGPPAKKKLAA